jgi:hypothetical protein
MGCQGSKTAQPSTPVEQQAADTTLLKEPVADRQVVKTQESGLETPPALAKETPMDASPDAAALDDAKIGATQDAEIPKTAEIPSTQDAATSKDAESPAIEDATTLKAAEAPTPHGATGSNVEETPAMKEGAISNGVETPAEMEAAGATPPDTANKSAEDVATANDEVNVGRQVPPAEPAEQNPGSPEPKVETGAAKSTPVQDLADDGVSANQAEAAEFAVPKAGADPTATAKQVAIDTQGGCCSSYCLATEVQNEIAVQKD